MVFRLPDDEVVFPNPELANPDGLLAIGGDLSMDRLLLAYENGIFPWFSEDDPICWYAPHERCVIFPEEVKISKSMAKIMNSRIFTVTWNTIFDRIIGHCARTKRKDEPGTWITAEMQEAYVELHKSGHAASVEVWMDGQLAGGLYGVLIGDVFCGESMFSLVSNASKTALIWLCKTRRFKLIDCQLPNDHLMSLGAEMISRSDYIKMLRA
ncbi:MAG TPA: leucyl/phenylalanyl-tRNA--protein transferase [Pedobacter sp.]|nr:leucyl/phenylalanyl-tRNA--protein transferase [Pedobacter sp.]